MSTQYDVFRKDREDSNITQTKGGGVLIAIKKNMYYEEVKFDIIARLEAVCIKIQQNDSSLYIYAVYIQYRQVDDMLAEFYDDDLKAIL